jgi:hypothetical protein
MEPSDAAISESFDTPAANSRAGIGGSESCRLGLFDANFAMQSLMPCACVRKG